MFFFSVHLLEGSPPITCTSCDPNGRETTVEGFNLQLADSAIFIFRSCDSQCVLYQKRDFDPLVCSPSYLQPPISDPHQLYIICASKPRVLPVSYSARNGNFSIRPFQEATDEFAPTRGIVVGGINEVGRNDDFLIGIDSDRQSIGLNTLDGHVIPDSLSVDDTSCDAFEALYPMDPSSDRSHPRFLLQCSQDTATKLYEVTLDFTSGNPRASGEVPGFMGSPILSPNSTYLCLWTNTSITIFQTADYSKQQFKSFASPITAAYFVQSDPPSHKLYVSAGPASVIIDVAEFFADPGSGVVAVPGSAANCASNGRCLPQRLSGNHHLVIVRDGSAWQARIYRVDEPSEEPTVFHLSEPPVSAFLQVSSSPSPTPNMAWIIGVGIAVAVVISILLVVVLVLLYIRRKRRDSQSVKPTDPATPSLKANPAHTAKPDKSNKETLKDSLDSSQIETKVDSPVSDIHTHHTQSLEQPQIIVQASTPHTERDKMALPKPDRTTLTPDRGPTHLTPQPDRHLLDSGVNSSVSTLNSSSSLPSLPSRSSSSNSSSSSVMGSRSNSPSNGRRSNSPGDSSRSNSPGNGRRSNSPGDGRSSSSEDLPSSTQVYHSSSSRGGTQLVAPQFSQHLTSP